MASAHENGEFFVDVVVDEIKKSELFCDYKKAKLKLSENSALSEQLAEFRRFSLNLRLNVIAGKEISADERRHASNMYWQLALNDDVRVFLDYEKKLSDVVNDAFKRTVTELDLNTSFFV